MTRWNTERFRAPRPWRCGAMRWLRLCSTGAALFGISGCLGPNPGFFISTSVANAAISTLVGDFLRNLLGGG